MDLEFAQKALAFECAETLNPMQLGRVWPTLWIVKSNCTRFIDRGLTANAGGGGGGGGSILTNSSQVTDTPRMKLCYYGGS